MAQSNEDTNFQYNNSSEFNGDKKEIFFHDNVLCFICKCIVYEPYIRCAECNIILCVQCFASGKEQGEHQNNHDYTIIKNDFPIIKNSDWSAKEEKDLLNLIEICGFGNWPNISKKLPGRSEEECKKHYLKNYIDSQYLTVLPKVKFSTINYFDSKPIPFAFTLKDLEKPPRYTFENPNYNYTSGYNAARSDFEINHDNDAELLVSKLKYKEFSSEDQAYELGQAMQLALVSSYNMRLKERARRKKVVRDHGLISIRKGLALVKKFNTEMPVATVEKFLIFSQLISGIEFDAIMICLHKIANLKNHIRELKNYRINGIKYFHSIPLFKELSNFRKESDKLRKLYPSIGECDFNNITYSSVKNSVALTNNFRRKKAAPIEIHAGMQDFNKLSEDEVQLCSVLRLVPKDFIRFKQMLISENEKNGCVKLAKARPLLKIDVNKTKLIHEYLEKEGLIRTS